MVDLIFGVFIFAVIYTIVRVTFPFYPLIPFCTNDQVISSQDAGRARSARHVTSWTPTLADIWACEQHTWFRPSLHIWRYTHRFVARVHTRYSLPTRFPPFSDSLLCSILLHRSTGYTELCCLEGDIEWSCSGLLNNCSLGRYRTDWGLNNQTYILRSFL